MTPGAPCISIEDGFAAGWIARHCSSFGLSLKDAEIFDEGTNGRRVEAIKRRHAAGWNSIRDDLCDRGVSSILSLLGCRDVGSALAASTIEPMTRRAAVFECLAGFGDRALILRWVLLRGRCTFDAESEREKSDSHREECESFENGQSMRMIRASIREPAGAEKSFHSLVTGHGCNFSDTQNYRLHSPLDNQN